jgi:hypothetical protein
MNRADAIAAVLLGFVAGLIVAIVFVAVVPAIDSDDLVESYEKGQRQALRVNPPSEALERVCAGLWIEAQPVRP